MPNSIDLTLIEPVLQKYRYQDDALISMLQEMQGIYGYLPEEVLLRMSQETKIPMSRIYAVATFYAQFYLNRRGRNIVRVCRGTACHVRGSRSVIKAVEGLLGIKDGETSADYGFTLETVACLGACAMGPVMVTNERYHGKMTPAKAETVLRTIA